MRDKSLRRRIPANRRVNSNDHATPRSSSSPAGRRRRIKPARIKPSKGHVNILRRCKSEPSLLRGVGEDEGVLYRPETWSDIFTSPETSTPPFPRKCYQKDSKVVVSVSVEGSVGPIQTLVPLGSNVEETINLVITKYNQQGRIPPLDNLSASTYKLHQSYFSLHSLSKSELIGDIGCRSFYLRKHNNTNTEGANSSYQLDVKLNSSRSQSASSSIPEFLFYCDIKNIIRRSRKFCNFFGCIPCIG